MSLKLGKLSLKVVNGNTIELSSSVYVEEQVEDEIITQIKDTQNNKIKLKDTFAFDLSGVRSIYEVNHITKILKNTYLLSTELRNKSTYYILPLLEKLSIPRTIRTVIPAGTLEEISRYCAHTYLINCYIGTLDGCILDGNIYLKFRYSSHKTYQTLESLLQDHGLYVETLEEGNFTIFKFKIPKERKKDIELFLKGKYSQLSEGLKTEIVRFYKLDKLSNMYQILYQGEVYRKKLEEWLNHDLKGLELESVPDKNNEFIIV